MKKFIYILLFSLILFIPGNVKADTIFDFNYDDERFLDKLECTRHNDVSGIQNATCEGLGTRYYQYNSSTQSYTIKESIYNDGRIPLGSAFKTNVSTGPNTVYKSFNTIFTNSGFLDADKLNSYYYDFKKGKIYSLNYLFLVPKDVDIYLNKKDIQFLPYDENDVYIDNAIADSVVIQGYTSSEHDIYYNFNDYPGHIAITNTNEFYTVEFMIQFQAAEDIDHLDFIVGYAADIESIPDFNLYLTKNEEYDFGPYLGISDFSVTEISEFFSVPHGGGGSSLDKPTDEDVFSGYKDLTEGVNSCDGVDIGCWFSNLWIVLKNLVFNIGRFFVNILNYLWEVIDYAINLLLEPLKHLVDFVLIFWDDFVSFLQDSLKWFYDTFLKGPIDYIIESIKSFFTVDVNGINILLQELNESISSGDNSLSSIITKPLEIIQNLSNSYCTNITFTLPLINSTVSLPCMTPIYQTYFNSLFVVYQTLTTGFIAYWCLINIFAFVMDFKEPTGDKVEVLKL